MTKLKIALIGNPNVGKTSVFNSLTGMNQHTGNYPGITVDKKIGSFKVDDSIISIIDLPGVYSINPTSKDEEVALQVLFDRKGKNYPDGVVVVVDVENLKRNLLLFTQIKDLGLPTILCVNMADQLEKKAISIDIKLLEEKLKTSIVLVSAKKNTGIIELKQQILNIKNRSKNSIFDLTQVDNEHFKCLTEEFKEESYQAWLSQIKAYSFEDYEKRINNHLKLKKDEKELKKITHKEVVKRYQFISEILKVTYQNNTDKDTHIRMRLDRVLTHKFFGFFIFLLMLLTVYSSIFQLASYPMDLIDGMFAQLSESLSNLLPNGKLNDLLSNGIIPSLGGVLMFIPQIAILFTLLSLLEQSGYMSRAVFLMDKFMRPFGLNGKSVVPLVSGTACAIPAVMAARNIENYKERLITMLVTPFTTCAARIPVYIIIISLVIPDTFIFGFIPLQGLVLTGLYFLGFFVALMSGMVLSKFIKLKQSSDFIIEMPTYKMPIIKNVLLDVYEKIYSYAIGAGKIILSLSIILWFLGSYGPNDTFGKAEEIVMKKYKGKELSQEKLSKEITSYKLKKSYIGIIGHTIEPVFRPLGYDWKLSIAVITTFAAREVFGSTLGTIYGMGGDLDVNDQETQGKIINKMAVDVHPNGDKIFTLATGVSLLLYYAFAMQCLSTVAITRKETNSWKWTMFQLVFMSMFAYIVAMIAFKILK